MESFPIVGDDDIEFVMYILEDGRHVYAISVDDRPVLGFDVYGADDLINAIRECVRELEGFEVGDYS